MIAIVLPVANAVAVPELPDTLPVIVAETVNPVNVPTDVKLLAVTPDASDAPESVPAAAVTVIAAEPSNDTPLIARAVCNVVAVEALPVVF